MNVLKYTYDHSCYCARSDECQHLMADSLMAISAGEPPARGDERIAPAGVLRHAGAGRRRCGGGGGEQGATDRERLRVRRLALLRRGGDGRGRRSHSHVPVVYVMQL